MFDQEIGMNRLQPLKNSSYSTIISLTLEIPISQTSTRSIFRERYTNVSLELSTNIVQTLLNERT